MVYYDTYMVGPYSDSGLPWYTVRLISWFILEYDTVLTLYASCLFLEILMNKLDVLYNTHAALF